MELSFIFIGIIAVLGVFKFIGLIKKYGAKKMYWLDVGFLFSVMGYFALNLSRGGADIWLVIFNALAIVATLIFFVAKLVYKK